MSRWVVAENPPEGGEQVLGYFVEGGFQVTYRERIMRKWYWMDTTGAAIGAPTHWQPLPLPPESENPGTRQRCGTSERPNAAPMNRANASETKVDGEPVRFCDCTEA